MSTATSCDYCGLPVAQDKPSAADDRHDPQFCCYGCAFAAAVAGSGGPAGAANWVLARLGLAVFLTMNVLVFTMALWTQDMYEVEGSPSHADLALQEVFRYLGLLFSLPVLWILGEPLVARAWRQLCRRTMTTDL